jgi:branched-chain amino acid transport system substrate-binding protein
LGTTPKRLLAALLASSLVMAACGDDDDDSGDGASGGDAAPSSDLECPGPEASGDPVLVGVTWPEGPAISLPELGESANAAADYANDCLGGIAGRPIELVDCQIDEANAASAGDCADQLVEAGVVAGVVTITAQGSTLVPAITGAGIPYIAPSSASAEESNNEAGLVYILGPGTAGNLGGLAQYAQDQGYSRINLVVTENAAAGVEQLAAIPLGNAGLEYELVTVAPGSPDITPQVSAALESDPDILMIISDATLCISFLQAVEALQPDAEIALISTCSDQAVVDAVGESALDGKLLATTVDGTSDDPEAALFRAVMEEYSPDTPTGGFTGTGYQTMLGLVRGTQGLTGDVTPETVAEAMRSTSGVDLPAGGGITFGCAEPPIQILSSICSSEMLLANMDGATPGDYEVIDSGPMLVLPG